MGVSTLTQLAAALASQGIGAWGAFAQDAFKLSAREIGGLATVSNLVPIVGLVLIGRILDRHGERLPVFVGMLILGLSMALLCASSRYEMLVVSMLLLGAGYSPIQPGGSKAIYHWFPARERGLAMGIRQAALPLGGACAAAFFPAMIKHAGWQVTMIIAAALISVAGLVYFMVFRNAQGPRYATETTKSVFGGLSEHLRNPQFRRISLVGAMLVCMQTAVSVFWVTLVQYHFGAAPLAATWYLFVVQMSGSLGRICLSGLSDHVRGGRRRVVLACLALTPVAVLATMLLPASSHGLPVVIGSAFTGLFCFGWYGPWAVWLSESAGRENVGEIIGSAMAINQVAIASTPLLFGLAIDLANSTAIPVFSLCGALAAVFVWNRIFSLEEEMDHTAMPSGKQTGRMVENDYRNR
ncbi:hypothetical protein WK22_17795 [Burkholderia multivorans]|nr:hypothetical protein WK22_17795 [Burkholderia multivorans]